MGSSRAPLSLLPVFHSPEPRKGRLPGPGGAQSGDLGRGRPKLGARLYREPPFSCHKMSQGRGRVMGDTKVPKALSTLPSLHH